MIFISSQEFGIHPLPETIRPEAAPLPQKMIPDVSNSPGKAPEHRRRDPLLVTSKSAPGLQQRLAGTSNHFFDTPGTVLSLLPWSSVGLGS